MGTTARLPATLTLHTLELVYRLLTFLLVIFRLFTPEHAMPRCRKPYEGYPTPISH